MLSDHTFDVYFLPNIDAQPQVITEGWFVSNWIPGGKGIYIFGWPENSEGYLDEKIVVRKIDVNGHDELINLDKEVIGEEAYLISNSVGEHWLLTITSAKSELWEIENTGYVFSQILDEISFASFSPVYEDWLAYIDYSGKLFVWNISTNEKLILNQESTSTFQWARDGKLIIFSKVTEDGGDSIWIADPEIAIGGIKSLSISPDGQKLVFETYQSKIEMLYMSGEFGIK